MQDPTTYWFEHVKHTPRYVNIYPRYHNIIKQCRSVISLENKVGQTVGWTDSRTDSWAVGRTVGRTNEGTEGWSVAQKGGRTHGRWYCICTVF